MSSNSTSDNEKNNPTAQGQTKAPVQKSRPASTAAKTVAKKARNTNPKPQAKPGKPAPVESSKPDSRKSANPGFARRRVWPD